MSETDVYTNGLCKRCAGPLYGYQRSQTGGTCYQCHQDTVSKMVNDRASPLPAPWWKRPVYDLPRLREEAREIAPGMTEESRGDRRGLVGEWSTLVCENRHLGVTQVSVPLNSDRPELRLIRPPNIMCCVQCTLTATTLIRLSMVVAAFGDGNDNSYLLPPKITRDTAGLVHSQDGNPAVLWPDGGAQYAIHGVSVPRSWVRGTHSITAETVLSLRNTEQRRVALDIYGRERFIENANLMVAHEDIDNQGNQRRLLKTGSDVVDPLAMMEVSCPSTGRKYLIMVDPWRSQTCRGAIASTFNIWAEGEYAPVMET